MKRTESFFGLIRNSEGQISADNGLTWLEMPVSEKEFQELVQDIENWNDSQLSEEDISDLREILAI